MKYLLNFLLLVLSLLFSGTAVAQSISIAELEKKINDAVEHQNGYLALLSDPDPRRAREAMNVFLASGDAELVRMALDFGLSSSNPALQRLALEGFFNDAPALQITFDGSALDSTSDFHNDLKNLNGSLSDSKIGYANLKLGPWSDEQDCWLWPDSDYCGVRLTDAASSIHFRGYWYPMHLEDGILKGVSNMHYTKMPVPFSIPVER